MEDGVYMSDPCCLKCEIMIWIWEIYVHTEWCRVRVFLGLSGMVRVMVQGIRYDRHLTQSSFRCFPVWEPLRDLPWVTPNSYGSTRWNLVTRHITSHTKESSVKSLWWRVFKSSSGMLVGNRWLTVTTTTNNPIVWTRTKSNARVGAVRCRQWHTEEDGRQRCGCRGNKVKMMCGHVWDHASQSGGECRAVGLWPWCPKWTLLIL